MANPVKGEVPLHLADKRALTLVMDFEALVQGESAYGKPMAAMLLDARQGFVGATRAILWGALRTHHPEVTLREAADMLRTDGEAVEAALTAATEAAYPTAEGGDGKNPPQSARAGKSSGASGAKRASSPTRSGGKRRAASA